MDNCYFNKFPYDLSSNRVSMSCLTSGQDSVKDSVIAHETAHIKRGDHLIKPLGFLLLSVYWFQPLLWVAYICLCRDIEAACDEKAIRKLDDEVRHV